MKKKCKYKGEIKGLCPSEICMATQGIKAYGGRRWSKAVLDEVPDDGVVTVVA